MLKHGEMEKRETSGAGRKRSRKYANRWVVMVLLILPLMVSVAQVAAADAPKPGPRDKCAVCGMFVAGFPNWISVVVFKDGSRAFFDGPKDMFKYLVDLKRYNPKKQKGDMADIFVTDYYNLKPIDARKAWYVAGSDIEGPMGHELVPLAKEADAKGFLKDHKGKKILKFDDVTADTVGRLDHGAR